MASKKPLKQAKLSFGQSPSSLESCKPLDEKISKLSVPKKMVYLHLKRLLKNHLEARPDSAESIYNWTPLAWHNIIVGLADRVLWNAPASEDDCYMTNPEGPSTIHVTPVEYRQDSPQQGYRLLAIPDAQDHRVPVYRLTAALWHPEHLLELQKGKTEGSHELQLAHRCKHEAVRDSFVNPCWNPSHGILTDDVTNKRMNRCWNGAGFLCPHDPKCIWTDEQGILLPCRNKLSLTTCSHSPSCWETPVGWKN